VGDVALFHSRSKTTNTRAISVAEVSHADFRARGNCQNCCADFSLSVAVVHFCSFDSGGVFDELLVESKCIAQRAKKNPAGGQLNLFAGKTTFQFPEK
jgi:hypothetical protein